MKVIQETIGSTTILIQAIDEPLEVIGETRAGRATQTTGIEDNLKAAYSKVKAIIKEVAEDIGRDLKQIAAENRPKQVQIEYNIGISVQAGPVWVISGTREHGLKITMTWDLEPGKAQKVPGAS